MLTSAILMAMVFISAMMVLE
ncbi:MAG: hypothetical protein EA361_07635 [Bacteroidetes bacterium]|nr:MAG: hypothetical protein EA361_07635 [Bacteroidota bacterium]